MAEAHPSRGSQPGTSHAPGAVTSAGGRQDEQGSFARGMNGRCESTASRTVCLLTKQLPRKRRSGDEKGQKSQTHEDVVKVSERNRLRNKHLIVEEWVVYGASAYKRTLRSCQNPDDYVCLLTWMNVYDTALRNGSGTQEKRTYYIPLRTFIVCISIGNIYSTHF